MAVKTIFCYPGCCHFQNFADRSNYENLLLESIQLQMNLDHKLVIRIVQLIY